MVDRDAAHGALDAVLSLVDELEPRRLTTVAGMLWDHRVELVDLTRVALERPEVVGALLDRLPLLLDAAAAAGRVEPDTRPEADDPAEMLARCHDQLDEIARLLAALSARLED